MANQSVRVAAAARAAAKRAEKARRPGRPGTNSSRTLSVPALEADAKARAQPDADTGSESRTAPAEKPPRHRSGLLSAVLAVLVVTGLAATAILGFLHREAGRTDQARAGALAAARKAAPVVLSYDYRHLDRDFATARGHLTGSFRDEYGKTTKSVVAPTAKKYRGVVKATVAKPPGAGAPAAVSVVSASPDKAVILLFMNQVTNSTQVSGPRVDLNRVRMTLVPTSQGWKVSAVDAL